MWRTTEVGKKGEVGPLRQLAKARCHLSLKGEARLVWRTTEVGKKGEVGPLRLVALGTSPHEERQAR